MKHKPTILVVDDERYVRESLVEVLDCEGFACVQADGVATALAELARTTVQAVVTDLRMPGGDGIELLAAAREQGVGAPVIVMTGVGSLREAVDAMKLGAFDFLQKPVDPDQLALLLRRAIEHRELVSEVRQLRAAVGERASSEIVGRSAAIARVLELVAQVAPRDANVLVLGESGSGKELVAEALHRASERAGGPLVRVNCAAIPEQLFESEFFGHRRGAFSGAVADRVGRFAEARGGTLVLDEIGTLPLAMQAKLLRVLEGGEFQVVGESKTRIADVRVIALSNDDLDARVKSGAFRADLFYRLNVFPIDVPPLRARKDDLPLLVEHLLAKIRGRRGPALSREALDVLASYDWPGNVRELRNVLERALILGGEPLEAATFRALLEASAPVTASASGDDCHLRRNLDAAEKQLVLRALDRSRGKKKEAAQLLGIDPRNLGYYLRKHELSEGEK